MRAFRENPRARERGEWIVRARSREREMGVGCEVEREG